MTKEISNEAATLLLNHRLAEGASGSISEGAVMLATMLAIDDPAIDQLTMFVGGTRSLERMIAGTLDPCLNWGEEMGRLTEGRLTSAMFVKAWRGEMPLTPELEIEPTHPSGMPVDNGALAYLEGRLGEVPSGPLFHHVIDSCSQNSIVVTGLGLGLNLGEAVAFALKDAITAGLLDLRTRREAAGARA